MGRGLRRLLLTSVVGGSWAIGAGQMYIAKQYIDYASKPNPSEEIAKIPRILVPEVPLEKDILPLNESLELRTASLPTSFKGKVYALDKNNRPYIIEYNAQNCTLKINNLKVTRPSPREVVSIK